MSPPTPDEADLAALWEKPCCARRFTTRCAHAVELSLRMQPTS